MTEVFEVVIPRYHGMNISELDLATHESDLHRIVQAAGAKQTPADGNGYFISSGRPRSSSARTP